jgi:hypothetical protein
MTEQLYRKKGRRYVPIGYSDGFNGFPSDGFWLVQQRDGVKSSECIIKIDDLENLKPAANFIYAYKDRIVDFMLKNEVSSNSLNQYVLQMIKNITK